MFFIPILFTNLALLFNSSYALTFQTKNKLYFGQSRTMLELNSTEVEPIYIMEKQQEIWKDAVGYEGLYQVSNFGNVKSLGNNKNKKERLLKLVDDGAGYLRVGLSKDKKQKTKRVHQLVAQVFLNHVACGHQMVVNHKDFNRLNNHVDNLEIVTSRENTNLKHIKSTSEFVGVYWNKNLKKWHSRIVINGKRKHLGYFIDELEASNVYQTVLNSLIL